MNTRHRIAWHLAGVLTALALGFGARALLFPAPETSSGGISTGREADGDGSRLPSEVAPVFGNDVTAFSTLAADRMADLRHQLNATAKQRNSLREELRLKALLTAGIHSPDDLPRAFELLDAAGGEYFRQQTGMLLVNRWADRDPVALLTALASCRDRQLRQSAIHEVVKRWAAKDLEAALHYVRTQADIGFRTSALQAVYTELAKRDPIAALERAGDFNSPNFFHGLERTVLAQWLEKDREAALQYVLKERADVSRREQLIRAAAETLSYKDPVRAWEIYHSLPPDQRKDPWFPLQLFSSWIRRDAEQALEFAASLEDAGQRRKLINEAGRYTTWTDEAKARTLAEKLSGPERQLFLAGMAESFISDSHHPRFSKAAEIALGLTDQNQQVQLMRSLGSRWARVDAPGASEWLTHQPEGPLRDAAVGEFMRGVFQTDPDVALTWTASISDQGKRGRRFDEYFPKWVASDPAAAASWLNKCDRLSSADRDSLRQKLSTP